MPFLAPIAAPERKLAPLLLAAAALLATAGCENVPPFLDRSYLKVGAQGLYEPLQAEADRARGPFPGLSATLGTLLEVERTRSSAIEGEIQAYTLDPGGDFDGYGFRYLAGGRWAWNLDQRWRPNVGLGAIWTDFHLDDHDRKYDPNGPGGYGDVGIDWMITPRHGIGLRVRGSLRYEEASYEHGLKAGLEVGLQSVWRF